MILKRFQRIYEQEPFIQRVRALYLFIFNILVFAIVSIILIFFYNKKEPTYNYSFIVILSAVLVSTLLLWFGKFQKALFIALISILIGITWALLFGNIFGNILFNLPNLVVLFLLFTNIRTTILISAYTFVLLFLYFYRLYLDNSFNIIFAMDSVLAFFFFNVISILAVHLLNSYIREKNELIKEIHHRVRNNLQVLCGLADLHKNDRSDSQSVLSEFQNRVLAMSEVHNFMYQSDNYHNIEFSDVIKRIVENLKNKHKESNVNIRNHSEKIELPIETAIPCAMIFNELLNNSLTHAFKESQNPNIEIFFAKVGSNFKLTLKDNGSGIPVSIDMKKPNTTGFTLVHILSKQIHGNFELNNDSGLVATLEF
ncbi:sensor histidine kinase [Leptospira santarosai]|uniref:sensor histidine kinase n=1 Tax=Leptospira santarosai TaxID=28183 RepID=UPI0022A9DD53|nr:sensor histidine kinase [Leptospira santarosai]UZN08352.1 sensor histidine kinase [Leptospira santarosai]